MEVPGQTGLEFLLATHGPRSTTAKRQHVDHGVFIWALFRSDQPGRDRLGIRQSLLWQALLRRAARLREQLGLPRNQVQRRGDSAGSERGLKQTTVPGPAWSFEAGQYLQHFLCWRTKFAAPLGGKSQRCNNFGSY